jgi:hypothetical protein
MRQCMSSCIASPHLQKMTFEFLDNTGSPRRPRCTELRAVAHDNGQLFLLSKHVWAVCLASEFDICLRRTVLDLRRLMISAHRVEAHFPRASVNRHGRCANACADGRAMYCVTCQQHLRWTSLH